MILFLFLTLDFTLIFLNVAINLAPLSLAPRPRSVNSEEVALKVNLSALKVSKEPSDLTNTYLSSSNGKKVSFVAAVRVFD